VIVLLMKISTILSELVDLLCFISFKFINLSFLILKSSQKLLVFPDNNFFAFFNHFQFLLKTSGKLLSPFNFFISSFVSNVSNFFFEIELVVNQNIVKFLILHRKILNRK